MAVVAHYTKARSALI